MTDQPRPPRCDATTVAGQPCRGRPLPGSSRCFAHADELSQRRTEARARGGRNRSHVARRWAGAPQPVRDVLDELRRVLDDLRAGKVSPAHASAAASLGRAIVAVWDASVTQRQLDELEDIVRAIDTGRVTR